MDNLSIVLNLCIPRWESFRTGTAACTVHQVGHVPVTSAYNVVDFAVNDVLQGISPTKKEKQPALQQEFSENSGSPASACRRPQAMTAERTVRITAQPLNNTRGVEDMLTTKPSHLVPIHIIL